MNYSKCEVGNNQSPDEFASNGPGPMIKGAQFFRGLLFVGLIGGFGLDLPQAPP
jgi:hypothetical protein